MERKIVIPGPRNSPFGKLDHLLGRVPGIASASKGRFFAAVMGFEDATLSEAPISHLRDNAESSTLADERVIVMAPITGPSGHIATIRSIWQTLTDGTSSLITAYPERKP